MSTFHASSRGGRRAGLLLQHATSSPKSNPAILPPLPEGTGHRLDLHPSFALPSNPARPFHLPSTPGRSSLPTYPNSHLLNTTGQAPPPTPSHPLSPLHNIRPGQVDPLLFPRQLPNNPSLSHWCKWRPHQHSPAAQLQVRCSLPASSANLGRAHPGRRSGMAPVPESGMQ